MRASNGSDDSDPLMTEQERELERLREQLACLKRSSAAALAARREAAAAAASRRGGFGSISSNDGGGGEEEENYVVERRAARATLDKEEAPSAAAVSVEDPDVWPPPPPPPPRRPERGPAPRRPVVAAPAAVCSPPAGGLWAHHHHHQGSSPPPGSTGPIGRRPAVLSRPGGGMVLYPGGGVGGGGGAAAGSAPMGGGVGASSLPFPFASPAAALPPRRHQQQHFGPLFAPHLPQASALAAPPSTLFPSTPLLPPPPPHPSSFLLPHQSQIEDAALLAALERDVSSASSRLSTSQTHWDDIAGLSAAKRVLQEAAVLPLLVPALFTGIRRPPKGVLLHGPPGTGKTMLARAVACEATTAFFSASAATLASKYRGESERLVRALFSLARARAPCVVFLDEVDALCGKRGAEGEHEASRRFKAELLVQIDACAVAAAAAATAGAATLAASTGATAAAQAPRHVLVLAATNHPWDLDEALRRRLEKRVYVPLPDLEERRELLALCLKGVESVLAPRDLAQLAKRLEGYSGDDVTAVCREAALEGVRRTVAGKSPAELRAMVAAGGAGGGSAAGAGPVTVRDFEAAIARVRPSVSGGDAARHEAWSKEFGSA